jgi:hypothetical protein
MMARARHRNETPEDFGIGAALPLRRLPGLAPARAALTSGGGEQAGPRPFLNANSAASGLHRPASWPYRGGVVGCAMCPPSSLLEPGAWQHAPGEGGVAC